MPYPIKKIVHRQFSLQQQKNIPIKNISLKKRIIWQLIVEKLSKKINKNTNHNNLDPVETLSKKTKKNINHNNIHPKILYQNKLINSIKTYLPSITNIKNMFNQKFTHHLSLLKQQTTTTNYIANPKHYNSNNYEQLIKNKKAFTLSSQKNHYHMIQQMMNFSRNKSTSHHYNTNNNYPINQKYRINQNNTSYIEQQYFINNLETQIIRKKRSHIDRIVEEKLISPKLTHIIKEQIQAVLINKGIESKILSQEEKLLLKELLRLKIELEMYR
ncbi:MAG: hypothetical protein ACRCVW_03785 [Brevinema sp.]